MSFDPASLHPDAVSDETWEFVKASVAARDGMPSMENTPLPDLRKLMEEGEGAFPAPAAVDRA